MKGAKILTVIVFLAFLSFFSITFLISPKKSFSEVENRSLSFVPSFSQSNLFSGEFAKSTDDFVADQFPFRNAFAEVKAAAELILGKGENDGILLGENGQLARRLFDVKRSDGSIVEETDFFDKESLSLASAGLKRANENLNVPFSVLLTGRTIDVCKDSFLYPEEESNALLEELRRDLPKDLTLVKTVDLLREKAGKGEQVYYRTDHHWTTCGAYLAYCEVMKSFSMEDEIIPEENFQKNVVSKEFYGTFWSAGGIRNVLPDTVEFWLLGDEDDYTVTADGKVLDGFYSYEKLGKKDKYSAFLDGTHDVVTVTKKGDADRPTLLLLKDSFANSLAPFLARHFDLVLLNLSSSRKDYTDLSAEAKLYQADAVLLVYTIENVITDDRLARLR